MATDDRTAILECEDGFACDAEVWDSDMCFPVLAIGHECPYGDDPTLSSVCPPDAYCDDSTCQPRQPIGAPCNGSDECSSHYCVGPDGVCEPDTPLLCRAYVAPSHWR